MITIRCKRCNYQTGWDNATIEEVKEYVSFFNQSHNHCNCKDELSKFELEGFKNNDLFVMEIISATGGCLNMNDYKRIRKDFS